MKTKKLNIIIAVLSVLIVIECIVLVTGFTSGSFKTSLSSAKQLHTSDTVLSVNDSPIPAFDIDEDLFMCAEDLHNFGIDTLENSDGSLNLFMPNLNTYQSADGIDRELSDIPDGAKVTALKAGLSLQGKQYPCYTAYDKHLIPVTALMHFGSYDRSDNAVTVILGAGEMSSTTGGSAAQAQASDTAVQQAKAVDNTIKSVSSAKADNSSGAAKASDKKIIVLDPGHGKSSSSMSSSEKENAGYTYNAAKSQWGEWRHWKTDTVWIDCEASGCNGRHPDGGSCWYPISNGDRDTEPEIDLNNSLAAKKYLEQMGYEVRLTRQSNDENPSITQRLSMCYPNGDTSAAPDADAFICIHSNAGGGSGTAYIALSGEYDQKGISASYAEDGNRLGKAMNDRIVTQTSLSRSGNGSITGLGSLIAFCKSPVTCGYLEIGFYDNSSDLSILKAESDKIGQAIAEGINDYFTAQ